jgi:hypothetical protein
VTVVIIPNQALTMREFNYVDSLISMENIEIAPRTVIRSPDPAYCGRPGWLLAECRDE